MRSLPTLRLYPPQRTEHEYLFKLLRWPRVYQKLIIQGLTFAVHPGLPAFLNSRQLGSLPDQRKIGIQGDCLQTSVHTPILPLPSITVPGSFITKLKNATLPMYTKLEM